MKMRRRPKQRKRRRPNRPNRQRRAKIRTRMSRIRARPMPKRRKTLRDSSEMKINSRFPQKNHAKS
jgi:hypothetical protein